MVASNTYGRQVVVPLTNKSGGSVAAGDLVYLSDGSTTDSFTTGTTSGYTGGIGVAQETIANNATGRVLVGGYAALVNVNASVTLGHFVKGYTVAKQATDAGASRGAGTCGIFLTTGATPDAVIWQPDLGGGSGLTAIANASVVLTSGNITGGHGQSAFTAITASALDLTIAASAGDVLEICIDRMTVCAGSSEIVWDVATVVSGSLTNYTASGSSTGKGNTGLYYVCGSGTKGQSATWLYTVVSGDISGGNVLLRPVYYNGDAAQNPTIYASSYPFFFSVKNLKH